ncbi:MAG: hypothetical protein SGILL_002294 [Bacillariaceae sp.]
MASNGGSNIITDTSALYEPPAATATTSASSDDYASDAANPTKTSLPPKSSNTNRQQSQQQLQQPPLPLIQSLKTLDEFCEMIDNAPPNTLVAMKFYGTSCPLCKRISIKYKKMSRFYGNAPIVFCEIHNRAHPQLFDTLGITTFPYLQLYRNQQCIASHATVSETVFERIVNDTIQQFLSMRGESQWTSFLENFQEPIAQASRKYQVMREVRDNEKAQQQQQQQQQDS